MWPAHERRSKGEGWCIERGKRNVYCNKQVGKVVTVLNCMLKGLWGCQKEIKK